MREAMQAVLAEAKARGLPVEEEAGKQVTIWHRDADDKIHTFQVTPIQARRLIQAQRTRWSLSADIPPLPEVEQYDWATLERAGQRPKSGCPWPSRHADTWKARQANSAAMLRMFGNCT